jgi:hypothetical protein
VYDVTNKLKVKGLTKFGCQINLYTGNEVYQINPPEYTYDQAFTYWDVGYLDVKNVYFYELGQMTSIMLERTLFFREWINFLEIIIQKKLYDKLFQFFGFQISNLEGKDRLLHEPEYFNNVKKMIFDPENAKYIQDNCDFNTDFFVYICNLFKNLKNRVSYTIFKTKISSNLKNFRDLSFTTTFKEKNKGIKN